MGRKLESFNDRSMRVVQLSNLAALLTRSAEIGTDHLLLGLVRGGTDAVARVFRTLGVEQKSLKSSVLSVLPPARDPAKWRKVPFSSLAVRVFDQAREQAASLGKNYVGPSHLLLGLLKVADGPAFKILTDSGVTYDQARAAITKITGDWSSMRIPRLVQTPTERMPANHNREPPRPDQDLIEGTKQQIRKMVREIDDLAKRDVEAIEFFRGFLPRLVSSLAARGGAIWMVTNTGALKLVYQVDLPESLGGGGRQNYRLLWRIAGAWWQRVADRERPALRHAMLLQQTITEGKGTVIEPHWGEGDGEQACNPTDALLIFGVLQVERRTTGVVEIFQRPGAPATTQRGYLKFVAQMCAIANEYLQRHQ